MREKSAQKTRLLRAEAVPRMDLELIPQALLTLCKKREPIFLCFSIFFSPSLCLVFFFCICADGLQRRLRQCSSKCTVQCAYTRADSLRLSSVGPRVLQRSCFPTTKIHRHVTAHANQHCTSGSFCQLTGLLGKWCSRICHLS